MKRNLIFFIQLLVILLVIPAGGQDFPTTNMDDPDDIGVYDPTQTGEEPVPEPAPAPKIVPQPPIRLAQKVVMLGRVPYMNIKDMMSHAKSLLLYLRKEMGVKDVRLVTAKDYSGVLDALSRGTIDVAWLGPMAYVLGKDKVPMTPLVKTKRRAGSSYRGVFITRKDSGILGIEDIKGKVVGFVDPESASGYLYPLYVLKRSKINPHKDCKKVEFLKKHDAILAAVLEKRIDAGVCLEDTLATLKDKNLAAEIMTLGKTDEVPSDVIACREDCPINLRDKLKDALLKIKSETGSGAPPMNEFLATTDEEFDPVRGVLKEIKDIRQ